MLHLNDIKYGHFDGELLDLSNIIDKIRLIAKSTQGKLVDVSAPPFARFANYPDTIEFNDLLVKLDGKRIFIDIAEEDEQNNQKLQNIRTSLDSYAHLDLHYPKYQGKPSEMLNELEEELSKCDAAILLHGDAPKSWLEERIVRCKFNHIRAQMLGKPKLEEWVYIVSTDNKSSDLLEELPKYIRLVKIQ